MTGFGKRLQGLRKQRSLTQMELADALSVSQTTVSAWERRDDAPREDILKQLSSFFNVSVLYLFGPSEDDIRRQEEREQAAIEYVEQRKWERWA